MRRRACSSGPREDAREAAGLVAMRRMSTLLLYLGNRLRKDTVVTKIFRSRILPAAEIVDLEEIRNCRILRGGRLSDLGIDRAQPILCEDVLRFFAEQEV